MGAADLVPGISGGTIAFIMGFYSDLLNGIKSFSVKNIFKPQTKFLGLLLCGILLSLALFAPLFDKILNDSVSRSFLYSGFLGLILASICLCIKQIEKWKPSYFAALVIGALLAFVLTSLDLKPENAALSQSHSSTIDLWLVFCGSIAVCALLLPGISGSYLLTILGCYSKVIEALADFIVSAKKMIFDFEAFSVLFSLSIGILLGAMIFSRVVLFLLKNYRSLTISLMTGFMIGALPAVWPFWSYISFINPLRPEKGLRLQPDFPVLPQISSSLSLCFLLLIAGFLLVFTVEYLAKREANEKLNQQ